MTKKYVLTKEKKVEFGVTLFRIKANVAFGIVVKGELGGWIEKENNLDQSGNAWVSGNARVSGNAWVYGNARVFGDAWVYGNARVFGDAHCGVGWYFAYKEKDWKITEVPSGNGILLVKDYQPPKEPEKNDDLHGQEVTVTIKGKTYTAVVK